MSLFILFVIACIVYVISVISYTIGYLKGRKD